MEVSSAVSVHVFGRSVPPLKCVACNIKQKAKRDYKTSCGVRSSNTTLLRE